MYSVTPQHCLSDVSCAAGPSLCGVCRDQLTVFNIRNLIESVTLTTMKPVVFMELLSLFEVKWRL